MKSFQWSNCLEIRVGSNSLCHSNSRANSIGEQTLYLWNIVRIFVWYFTIELEFHEIFVQIFWFNLHNAHKKHKNLLKKMWIKQTKHQLPWKLLTQIHTRFKSVANYFKCFSHRNIANFECIVNWPGKNGLLWLTSWSEVLWREAIHFRHNKHIYLSEFVQKSKSIQMRQTSFHMSSNEDFNYVVCLSMWIMVVWHFEKTFLFLIFKTAWITV